MLANESLSAELLLRRRGRPLPGGRARSRSRATTSTWPRPPRCSRAWDRRCDLDSVGAAAVARDHGRLPADGPAQRPGRSSPTPSTPTTPVATPARPGPRPDDGPDPCPGASATRCACSRRAGVAIDAPLGEVQWAQRGDAPRAGARRRRGRRRAQHPRPGRRPLGRTASSPVRRPLDHVARAHRPHRPHRRRLPVHLRHQLPDGGRAHRRRTRGHRAARLRPVRRRPLAAPRRRHRGLRGQGHCGRCCSPTPTSRPTPS